MLLLQGGGIRVPVKTYQQIDSIAKVLVIATVVFVSLSSSWSEAANKSAQLFQFFCIQPRFRDMSPSMLLPDDHQPCAGIGHR